MADLLLAAIMAVWGSSFAVLRGLLGGEAGSPLALVATRMLLASALLAAFLLVQPRTRAQLLTMNRRLLRDGLAVGGLLGFGFVLQTEGLLRTTASRSGFLTGTLVVLVPLLEYALFRKKPAPPALLGTLVAFGGITVLSAPWAQSASATFTGDALTLGCALVFAGHVILLGRVASRHPLLPLLLLQLAVTGLMAAALGPLIETPRFSNAPALWGAIVYLALFATLLAFGIQTWAQKVLPPVRVALLSSLEPVFAAIWAGVLIGERMSGNEWLGGALIVGGVLLGEAGSMLRTRAGAALDERPSA